MGERGILKACPLTIDGAYFSCQLRALVEFQHGKIGKKAGSILLSSNLVERGRNERSKLCVTTSA